MINSKLWKANKILSQLKVPLTFLKHYQSRGIKEVKD